MVQYSSAGDPAGFTLDHAAAAIADPTRRAILAQLARGSATVSDVAAPFEMTLTGVSKHIRVLERAGLVKRRRHGREKILELTPEPLEQLARWIHPYERFWNHRLDKLEAHFKQTKENAR